VDFKKAILFISEGFGSGRSPVAPGSCGSLVGILWFFLLLSFKNFYFYLFAIVFSTAIAVFICDAAEKILQVKDPSRVVLDEIIAIPICYLGWIFLMVGKEIPSPTYFLSGKKILAFAGVFLTFRLLDAIKPFPIELTQRLPGGIGIVADDVVAAIFTAVIWALVLKQFSNWFAIF